NFGSAAVIIRPSKVTSVGDSGKSGEPSRGEISLSRRIVAGSRGSVCSSDCGRSRSTALRIPESHGPGVDFLKGDLARFRVSSNAERDRYYTGRSNVRARY